MADPSGLAKTAFINNLLLVKALITTKPPQERARAKHWADVLSLETTTGEEFATRNEYLWYLLLALEYGNLNTPPFDKPPAPGRLKPLSTVIDADTYQKVLHGTKNEIYFSDTFGTISSDKMRRRSSLLGRSDQHDEGFSNHFNDNVGVNSTMHPALRQSVDEDGHQGTKGKSQPQGDYAPVEFLRNQPRPNQGAFCYGGVFSDYVRDEINDKQRRDYMDGRV